LYTFKDINQDLLIVLKKLKADIHLLIALAESALAVFSGLWKVT